MRFLRLGSAGMRGRIGSALNPQLAIDFASAIGTYLEGGVIVLGRDTRFSSPMLFNAVSSALLSCGCKVLDADICSAPLLHFLVPHLNADGGVLLGAGHHPAGWNAIVPLAANGAYYNSIQTQELLDVYHSRRFSCQTWQSIGSCESIPLDLGKSYLERLEGVFDFKKIAEGRFKVVMDFCNGSGTKLANDFAKLLGIEIIPLNNTISGILPHDPEPRPRSSAQAQSILKALQADLGVVFNSDVSRAAIITSSGETLSEEYTFPLVADHVLSKHKAKTQVVSNWCTTKTLDDIVKRHNGVMHKTKVGQAFLIDRMIELNAKLAGDGSGSVALGNHVLGFDGFLAAAAVLEAMAINNCASAELAESMPRYHIVKRKISCPSAHAYSLLRDLHNSFQDAACNEEDGFRFDWKDGWVHLRASMTEPIIRMILEWKTQEEAEERAIRIRGQLEKLVAS